MKIGSTNVLWPLGDAQTLIYLQIPGNPKSEIMELILKPATIDFRYRVVFKEPQFEIVKEGARVLLLNKIIKNFGLRLNDIKFNNQAPSNDFIHFSKFYGSSFFNVFFGL